jgi:hypothetical protein
MRLHRYSILTDKVYWHWIRHFILFHDKQHPKDLGAKEIQSFLSHLAVAKKVSASTQNQALSALLFLYQRVLNVDLPWLNEIVRSKRPARVPAMRSICNLQYEMEKEQRTGIRRCPRGFCLTWSGNSIIPAAFLNPTWQKAETAHQCRLSLIENTRMLHANGNGRTSFHPQNTITFVSTGSVAGTICTLQACSGP